MDVEPEVAFREGQKQKGNMKKLYLTIALAGVLAAPPLQAALEGTINIADSWGNGPGGAFIIDVTVATSLAMQQVQGSGDPFTSFCIEKNEYFVLGSGYSVTVDNAAIKGGLGGPQPDPLSMATAWLYSQFRANTLAASVLAQTGATWTPGTNPGGDQLQDAIWFFEQENAGYGAGTALITTAKKVLGYTLNAAGDAAAIAADANGAYGVRALNLYTVNGSGQISVYNQSQLAMVPEPTTMIAGALLLLPFGASTLRILRKNRTA